jgi:uncharacterized protein
MLEARLMGRCMSAWSIVLLAGHLVTAAAAAASAPTSTPVPPAEVGPRLAALPAEGYVHDAGGLLSAGERERLDAHLADLEKRTGHLVHLLILPQMEGGFGGLDPTVRAAAAKWGLGRDKEHAAILIVHVQNLDLLHAATDLGRSVPAIETGVGDVLSLIYRLSSAGDPDMGWRGAVERITALLENKRLPDSPAPRSEAIASLAGQRAGSTADAPSKELDLGAAPHERVTGYVIDEAGLLDPTTIEALNLLLHQNEERTSNQIVVLTLPTLGGEPIEEVSLRRASALGIGQKDKDNGVLLLVAQLERKVRIEVGYGLEGVLPDALCARIIRNEMVPRFKQADYDGGVREGIQAIVAASRGEYRATTADRARHLLSWLPARPSIPLVPQAIAGAFFWVFSMAWLFWGPELFSAFGKPVRLGVVPGLLVTSGVTYYFPGVLIPLGIGVLLWLDKEYRIFSRSSGGGHGGSWSPSRSSSSSSSYSSSSSRSSSSSSFSGGGGSFGGGGASGGW